MKAKLLFSKFELLFDILYLLLGGLMSLYILFRGRNSIAYLSGIMGLTLIVGDSFHLLPRMKKIYSNGQGDFQKALGLGKLITSITMTIFYLFLWELGLRLFDLKDYSLWTDIIYILAIARIILCLLPENKWLAENPPVSWGIFRNIPFLLEGIMVALLYFKYGSSIVGLEYMGLAISLSFLFYIPVVLFAHKKPMVGMLMLPKTLMYLWILWMFTYIIH